MTITLETLRELTDTNTNTVEIVSELRQIIGEEVDGLRGAALNGLVGAITALTHDDLERMANEDTTLSTYTFISPAVVDVEHLISNRALGIYTLKIATLMYRLGQNAATLATQDQPRT